MGRAIRQNDVRQADYALHEAYPGVFPETPWPEMSRTCEIVSRLVRTGNRVVDIG